MDKLTALRVFRRVVERESFSRAAKDLRLSTAAVSKNVRELEAELAAPLIHRTTRRLHLTPTGRAYYERAVAVLDALAEADRSVKELATSAPRGLLRVAAPMSLGLKVVGPAVNTFLTANPDVEVDLEMNDRLVDIVDDGFDVSIRGSSSLDDSSLVARKLGRVERVVVASPDYLSRHGTPVAPVELSGHRALVYSLAKSPRRWTFVRGAKKESVDVVGPLRVNSSLALVESAAAGIGVAFVPRVTAEHELEGGRLVALLPEWQGEPTYLHAVFSRHHETSRLVRAFVDHVARHLARTAHVLDGRKTPPSRT